MRDGKSCNSHERIEIRHSIVTQNCIIKSGAVSAEKPEVNRFGWNFLLSLTLSSWASCEKCNADAVDADYFDRCMKRALAGIEERMRLEKSKNAPSQEIQAALRRIQEKALLDAEKLVRMF